jgi:membrane protein
VKDQRLGEVRQWAADFGAAVRHAVDDNCFILAKAVSYSAVLALFPGLLAATNLLLRNNAQQTLDDISLAMGAVLPPRVRGLLADYLTVAEDHSTAVLLLAAAASLLFAADLVMSLMEGFRTAYRAPRRSTLLHEYAIAVALVFLSIGPLTAAHIALILSRQAVGWVLPMGVESGAVSLGALAAWWIVAVPTVTLMLSLLYYLGPHREQSWRGILPGAAMAAGLWAPATGLFTLYVQTIPRYDEFYGSISAVIVLLIWTYLSSVIVLLGCEFNAVRERRCALEPNRT